VKIEHIHTPATKPPTIKPKSDSTSAPPRKDEMNKREKIF
jgi:hypothetical protein